MNTTVLLGAGASVEAGIPTTLEMTQRIADGFRAVSPAGTETAIISFVLGGLLFQKGIRGEDPYSGVDVEELFAAVQLLGQRETLPAAAFVGSWHSMVDQLDRLRGSSYQLRDFTRKMTEVIVKQLEASLPPAFGTRSGNAISVPMLRDWLRRAARKSTRTPFGFDQAFSKAIDAVQPRAAQGQVFDNVANSMIDALRELVWIEDATEVTYLKPLYELAQQQGGLVISTLNYDNAVELLCESNGVECRTGINEWSRAGRFPLEADAVTLLKLHGSIDWVLEPPDIGPESSMPHAKVRKAAEEDYEIGYRPAVVFGQGSKLTAEGPYLDLLHAFRESLGQASSLIVVGYSFRDAHVNEYITQWLNQSPEHCVTVVNPTFRSLDITYADLLSALEPAQLTIHELSASAGLPLAVKAALA